MDFQLAMKFAPFRCSQAGIMAIGQCTIDHYYMGVEHVEQLNSTPGSEGEEIFGLSKSWRFMLSPLNITTNPIEPCLIR